MRSDNLQVTHLCSSSCFFCPALPPEEQQGWNLGQPYVLFPSCKSASYCRNHASGKMETAPPPLGSFVMLQARFHRHLCGDRRQSDYRRIPSPAWGQALREPLPKPFFERARSQADKPSQLCPGAAGAPQRLARRAGSRLRAGQAAKLTS